MKRLVLRGRSFSSHETQQPHECDSKANLTETSTYGNLKQASEEVSAKADIARTRAPPEVNEQTTSSQCKCLAQDSATRLSLLKTSSECDLGPEMSVFHPVNKWPGGAS